MKEIEEYEINLDYVTIPSLQGLNEKEQFIAYIQYEYVIKLTNLQVYLNSKLNEDSKNSEFLDYLKSFINIKKLDYFYNFLKSLQVNNLCDFELFFKVIKLNYELMLKQWGSARELNISVETSARIKGVYYPNYETKNIEFKELDCFYKKTQELRNLTKYIVKI